MRVLFSAQPLFGHVNTLLPLAEAAQRSGHQVAFATGASMTEQVEGRGFHTWAVGPEVAPKGADADWITYFLTSASQRAIDLVPRAQAWNPDLVVAEETELAAPVAAASVGARAVIHGLGLMPPLRIWEVFAPAIDALMQEWGVASTSTRVREALYLEVCPPSLRSPSERIWHSVQPIRHSPGQPTADESLPAAIGAMPHERLVHLTLGTVFNSATDVLATAIEGLRDLPANLVVTTGPGSDPDAFGPQPDNVLITPYLPHSLLLPRCDLVVSQAGAGAMFGALALGIPQVLLPQGADQHMNALACEEAGAGLALEGDRVTAGGVAAAACRLLEEPAFGQAARRLSLEMAAMPDADAVMAKLSGWRCDHLLCLPA